MKYNIKLILSAICLLYFTTLIYSSYNKLVFDNFFGAIFELITIPIIILTLIIYIIAIKDWFNKKFEIKSANFLTIIILTITIVMLVFASIYNI
jgi:hypothetical protein